MAKIIPFSHVSKRPRLSGGGETPRGELQHNPVTQAPYRLLVAFVTVTWPILRWFIAADVCLQLLRVVFLGGFAVLGALLHRIMVGVFAHYVHRLLSTPAEWVLSDGEGPRECAGPRQSISQRKSRER